MLELNSEGVLLLFWIIIVTLYTLHPPCVARLLLLSTHHSNHLNDMPQVCICHDMFVVITVSLACCGVDLAGTDLCRAAIWGNA